MSASIPATMPVIEITEPGGPDKLRPATRPTPAPGPGEVLIRVVAAGINGADISQRMGNYPPPPGASDILGLEASGVVAAIGAGVHRFKTGDQVCALLTGGGYAGYCTVPEGHVLPLPDGVGPVEAGGIVETACTVWTNVFERAGLQKGESLLVHGGSSGIGTTAIQIARAHGARVFATAGSAEKCAACEALGAVRAINYREEDFAAVIAAETEDGVDVILDIMAASYLDGNLRCLAIDGRLCVIALKGGTKAELNLSRLMRRRLTVTGSTLRARPDADKARLVAAVEQNVWPLFAAGKLRPVVDRVYPLSQAADAHMRMESSQHIGKILLTL
jgi:putative PIG3 family NAD(P)H quinone oxidoreductase